MGEGGGEIRVFQILCSEHFLLNFAHSKRFQRKKKEWIVKLSRVISLQEEEQKG